MVPREHSVLGMSAGGFHRMAYTEWGDPGNDNVLLCVHGLTRNGRDFDALAEALADGYRVLCPDVVGRGRSDWLADKSAYAYPQYLNDMVNLLARSGATQVDWVGTSMGGLIGMLLAALPHNPIRRLVLNDIGPALPLAALQRIAGYVGKAERFASIVELEQHLRQIAAPFGPLSDAQWQHLARYSAKQLADGTVVYRYDPDIAAAFKGPLQAVDLWASWQQIHCPTLVLRGVESDLLLRADAQAMTQRGPRAHLVEFPGVGHAPALLDAAQIAVVREWLLD